MYPAVAPPTSRAPHPPVDLIFTFKLPLFSTVKSVSVETPTTDNPAPT